MLINKMLIIGLGLMGGSLAKATKQANLCKNIVGIDKNIKNIQKLLSSNSIDEGDTNISADMLAQTDLLVIAVPVRQYQSVFLQIKPFLNNSIVITDLGSTKVEIIRLAESILGNFSNLFVPGHPIAGSERTGAAAAKADLFINRRIIITPTTNTQSAATKLVKALWENLNAQVELMNPEDHDRILALTSHLPHTLAFSIMHNFYNYENYQDLLHYSGPGFRDFSRIAAASPAIWTDILFTNKEMILQEIEYFQTHLSNLKNAIANDQEQWLHNFIEQAKQLRSLLQNN